MFFQSRGGVGGTAERAQDALRCCGCGDWEPPQTQGTSQHCGGALAEFSTALQVLELIESKCGSRAVPLELRRAAGAARSSVPCLL